MLLSLFLSVLVAAEHRASVQADTAGTCATDLNRLDAKIRENYPGFRIEAVGSTRTRYESALATLRKRAVRATGDECFAVLSALTDFFHDPHLFVYQSTRLDSAETRRRAAAVERRSIDEPTARAWFASHAKSLDPIEGIWYDREIRYAVMADPAGQRKTFIATLLTADSTTWAAGAVRARITRRANGEYAVDLAERNHAIRHLTGTLHRNVLLRLSPGIWGKAFPVPAADSGTLHPLDAHRATLRVRDGAVVIAVPSHDPTYRSTFDSLLQLHRDLLLSATKVVIDLRGNEGGSSGMTRGLRPYWITANDTPADDGDASGMLSSPDQINYALRTIIADTTKPDNRRFLDRLRAHPGELVPFFDSIDRPPAEPATETPAPGNRAVGFLMDRGTVSASEAMINSARRSPRVKTFGEESAGAIEYQSVSIVPFQATARRWYLGYPTITGNIHRTAATPRRGIIPDSPIDLTRTEDPVGEVIRRLGVSPR